MVVAVLQAALALFPLGLRFVFYPFLNLKGNHALEDMDPSSASSWGGLGGGVLFPGFEVLSVGRTILGRS